MLPCPYELPRCTKRCVSSAKKFIGGAPDVGFPDYARKSTPSGDIGDEVSRFPLTIAAIANCLAWSRAFLKTFISQVLHSCLKLSCRAKSSDFRTYWPSSSTPV